MLLIFHSTAIQSHCLFIYFPKNYDYYKMYISYFFLLEKEISQKTYENLHLPQYLTQNITILLTIKYKDGSNLNL